MTKLPDGWKSATLGDLVVLQRGHDLTAQEQESGNIPVMGGGGQNGSHSIANVKAQGVVIGRSGSGFGNAFFCDKDFWAHNTVLFVKDFKGNYPRYVFYVLDQIDFTSHNSGGAQPSLNRNFIYPIPLLIPPIGEQKKIAKIIDCWDKTIEKKLLLIKTKREQKRALMQRLLTGKLRFPEFAGQTLHIKQLGDFIVEVTDRNKNKSITRVLSVTNHSGFVLPEEQFSRRVASEDVSNYKIIRKGQFAYNPSRINVGSLARLEQHNEGILSPMYVIFKHNQDKLDSNFLLQWLKSDEAKKRIIANTQGSVRDSVAFAILSSFSFKVPSLPEQQKIAAVLCAADREIEQLTKKLNAYKDQKKGLMQQLLTGKKRININNMETA